ncbi:hypothetical protein N7505_006411 [Penicillium chrysogenum]|uniref:Nucleosome assembly protein n=1 Tax=Penicillium chrysogenum TaxID=5076 RepID=A0ABQ8WKS5_PENCH|nr:hypothetical protein N7505_006411 [Penicillium chrysogenum]
MSEPIRNKKADFPVAPTPQNTPANNAPISSHAQQPGVSSIEEESLDKAAAASLFARNPALVSMIQGKLGQLVGRSSGYIESLPPPSAAVSLFQEEVLELEKKYFGKFTPLYQRRSTIINGGVEPTEAEVEAGKEDEESDEEETKEEPKKEEAETANGIPEFWLSAMKNQISLAEMITERDEEALKHLTDIRMEYLDRPGFRLIFEFSENEFFTNKTISKTYFYKDESGYGGDFIYDHADGSQIDWKEDKDLTLRLESKKQRNKNTKQTRVVKISPPSEDDESVASDIEERLELDYQLGEDIKEKLIPRAIDWFTGEALQFEELGEDFDGDEFEDDDDDEEEDDEDEEDLGSDRDVDEEDTDEEDGTSKPKKEAAECKQN